ncbi:MAG: FxsA family protein [Alphaproteobacteria bacterium]|nr:FxsA family protein [Alphaproteobacteria bacterium]
MGFILLLIMIAVPIGEIAVFIEAGDLFGLWPTLGAVILTAVIGTAFLRVQGLGVLRRVQDSLARGDMPVSEMFDGLCLLVAGVLLLTPGFITDSVGFALLIAPFRRTMAAQIAAHLLRSGKAAAWPTRGAGGMGGQRPSGGGAAQHGTVIDGEFEDVSTDDKNDTDNPSHANRRIEP